MAKKKAVTRQTGSKTNGQPKVGRKGCRPTKGQLEERVEYVRHLLLTQVHYKSQVKSLVRAKYGKGINHRTIERYVARARALIRADYKISDEDSLEILQAKITHQLQTDMLNAENSPRERTRAADSLVRLYGLAKPLKFAQSDPERREWFQVQLAGMTEEEKAFLARLDRERSEALGRESKRSI